MPTYVYACDSCEQQFEVVQSFKDDPLTQCPCGQEGTVRRVFQPVGIVFKGSGWYITDSRESTKASQDSSTHKANSSKTNSDSDTATKPDTTENTSKDDKKASDTGSADVKSAA